MIETVLEPPPPKKKSKKQNKKTKNHLAPASTDGNPLSSSIMSVGPNLSLTSNAH